MIRHVLVLVLVLGCGATPTPSPDPSPSPTPSPSPSPTPSPDPSLDAVTVMELTAQPALLLRVSAPADQLESKMQDAMIRLFTAAHTAKLDLAGPPFARLVASDDASVITLDAGVPIVKPATGLTGDIVAGELPAGPAATLLHVGNRNDLPTAHATLERWLVANSRTAAGPSWQVFLTNPVMQPDLDAQETKIFVPLEPAP